MPIFAAPDRAVATQLTTHVLSHPEGGSVLTVIYFLGGWNNW